MWMRNLLFINRKKKKKKNVSEKRAVEKKNLPPGSSSDNGLIYPEFGYCQINIMMSLLNVG